MGSRSPEGIVESCDDTAVCWVRNLDDIHGTGSGGNRDAKAQDKSTTHEGVEVAPDSLDDGTDDDDDGRDKDAHLPSPGVDGGAHKGKGDDAANLIHGGDQAVREA